VDDRAHASKALVTYRSLPMQTANPTCVECVHCIPKGMDDPWVCVGFPRELARAAERNPITGEYHAAWYLKVYCSDKNAKGECVKFEPKPARPPRGPSRWRSLAARLGAWLIKWSEIRT